MPRVSSEVCTLAYGVDRQTALAGVDVSAFYRRSPHLIFALRWCSRPGLCAIPRIEGTVDLYSIYADTRGCVRRALFMPGRTYDPQQNRLLAALPG